MIVFQHAGWRFVGLELTILAAFALTLAHAIRHRRLFHWLVAAIYGLAMELISYAAFDNFHHGQFTIQLDHGKLPLYVVLLYPAFHYTGLALVERWHLRRAAEALLTGLAIALIDVPFDVAGPPAGWWQWSSTDPNLAARFWGVPVTSFYWYLLFGAIYAALTGMLAPRLAPKKLRVWLPLVPLVSLAIIVLGIAAFIPFHLLHAAGVPDQWIVSVHVAVCLALAALVRPRACPPLSPSLLAALVLLQAWSLVLVPGGTALPAVVIAVAMTHVLWKTRGKTS